jgi:hypothetical protein
LAIENFSTTGNTTLGDASTDTLNVGNGDLVKDSSGRVGIGTTSPVLRLHVSESNGSGAMQLGSNTASQYQYINFGGAANGQNAWQIGKADASSSIVPSQGFYLYDFKNSATRMVVDTSGNVGIGTASPSASYGRLTVSGTGISITPDTSAKLQIGRYSAGAPFSYIKMGSTSSGLKITDPADSVDLMTLDANGSFMIGGTTASGKLTVDPGSTSGTRIDGLHLPKNLTAQANYVAWQQGVNGWRVGIVYNDNTYPLAFYYGASTPTASSPGTELMRIDSDGNLGVGVTPNGVSLGGSYKLLSLGKSGGSGIFMGQTDLTTAGSYSAQFLGKTIGASGYQLHGGMVIGAEGSSSTNASGLVTFYTATGGTILERMRIDSGGFVGIGTTASYSSVWGADSWQLNIGGSRSYSSIILGNTSRFYSMGAGAGYHYMSYDHTAAAHNIIVNTTGVVALRGGAYSTATGVGIAFPPTQVASSDANTLDDYEEGTFTPTVIGTSTAGTASYSVQNSAYTKIGNLVYFQLFVIWTGGTGTGDLRIAGLPFTVKSNQVYPAISLSYVTNITLAANSTPTALLDSSTTQIYFYQIPSGGGTNLAITYDAAGSIILAGSYIV